MIEDKIIDLLSDRKHKSIKEIAEKLELSYNHIRNILGDMWWDNKIERTRAGNGSIIYFLRKSEQKEDKR